MRTLTCPVCDTEFETNNAKKKYCSSTCRVANPVQREVRRSQSHEYGLRRYYGIDLEEYNRLFIEQNGCCALCNKHQRELSQRLHVDHDHKTGKVRSLLCQTCNQGLGLFYDDPNLLKKAMEYVS